MILVSTGNIVEYNTFAYAYNSPIIFCDAKGFKAKKGKKIDLTDKLMNLMHIHANEFKKYINDNMLLGLIGMINIFNYFYQNVKTNGKWDLKNLKEWKFNPRTEYYFLGLSIREDDPGNIHFGYVGAVFFTLKTLQSGAGAYQLYQGTSDWSYLYSYFDDPRDSIMIALGYNLYKINTKSKMNFHIKKFKGMIKELLKFSRYIWWTLIC